MLRKSIYNDISSELKYLFLKTKHVFSKWRNVYCFCFRDGRVRAVVNESRRARIKWKKLLKIFPSIENNLPQNLSKRWNITQPDCRSRVPLEEATAVVVGETGLRLVQTGSSREEVGKSKSLSNLLPKSRRRKVRRRQRIGAARRMQVNIRKREWTLSH